MIIAQIIVWIKHIRPDIKYEINSKDKMKQLANNGNQQRIKGKIVKMGLIIWNYYITDYGVLK